MSDPLLSPLLQLSKEHGFPLSAESLLAGIPLKKGKLTPALALRALQRSGLEASVEDIALNAISATQLPALLFLNKQQAIVLLEIKEDKAVTLDRQGEAKSLELKALNRLYNGQALVVSGVTPDSNENQGRFWFWKIIFKGWPIYSESIFASFMVNLFALASPLFVMNVYDRVVPNDAMETLWVLAIGALLVAGFDFLLRTLRAYFIDVAGKRADLALSASIFEQLLGTRMEARDPASGATANHMREFEGIRDFFTSASMTTLVDLPFLVIFLGVIWMIGGPIVFVPLLTIPVVMIAALLFQIPMHRAIRETFEESTEKHAILVEAISSAETIKSENAEGVMQQKWEHYVERLAKSGMKSKLWSTLAINFTTFAHQITTIGIVLLGVHQISAGEMSVGALIASTILAGRALAPMTGIAGLLIRYRQSMIALKALHGLMKKPIERPANSRFLNRPPIKGAIEFRQVSFSYPSQEENALNSLNIRIQPGEHVAIVGRIGSGKTTLEKLLLGLYQPQEGSLLVDGTHLSQLDPAQLRRSIGYVSQEIVLFRGTLRDNIKFGTPQASDEELLKAAQMAGVDEFAQLHPKGYDMIVGERGEGLSGGQRQAVAMARALLLQPPILLLDEPTSSMDNSTENGWKARFTPFLKERTLILVTHRASLLSLAERLIILDRGQIVADGPRDQVLQALNRGELNQTN
ncbi:MAG: type I secretion system permease/ATPase [Gammaproteobacteria bacterium]|jgi:ATP-binding cassette subfamily C protein LapB|nr:type I secretion system permease/ATPase [Gammaproteobacteria bacterium]MBT7023806.1 type I secretion system permease/ATPase [Gammaproteobacteria bacterium]